MSDEYTSTALVETEATALVTPSAQELLEQLEKEIYETFIYFHKKSKKWEITAEGWRWLGSKFLVKISPDITIEVIEGVYEATCHAHSLITGLSANGSAVQPRIVDGNLDDTARAKVTTKCQRNGIKMVIPPNIFRTLLQSAVAKREEQSQPKADPPQQQRNTPETTNRSRAMYASAAVIEQLESKHGIDKDAMWVFFRTKYNVKSRNQFDPNGSEWGEIANRLSNASTNPAALDNLAKEIGGE